MTNLSIYLGMIGIMQIILILFVLFLVFGVRWIPKIFSNVKKRINEVLDEDKKDNH
jgi:Sec-independent protein translocase protein TatA